MTITEADLNDKSKQYNIDKSDVEQFLAKPSSNFTFIRKTPEGLLWQHNKYKSVLFSSGGGSNHGRFENPAGVRNLRLIMHKIHGWDALETSSGVAMTSIDLIPLGLDQDFEALAQGTKVTLAFKNYPELRVQFEGNGNRDKRIVSEAVSLRKQHAFMLGEIERLERDYGVECIHEKDTLHLVQRELGLDVSSTKNGQSFAEHLLEAIDQVEEAAQKLTGNRFNKLLNLLESGFNIETNYRPEKGGTQINLTHLANWDNKTGHIDIELHSPGTKCFLDDTALKVIESLEQRGLKPLSAEEQSKAEIGLKRIEYRKIRARDRVEEEAARKLAFQVPDKKEHSPHAQENAAHSGEEKQISAIPEPAQAMTTALCVIPDKSKWALMLRNPPSESVGRA